MNDNQMQRTTQESQNPSEKPKVFSTLDGNILMEQIYEPLQFCVEKILPFGLFIFAGSPKVGKSWLSLNLCQVVATGGNLWDFSSIQGDVLYLALEDRYRRLQERLKKIEAEKSDLSRLYLTTAAFGIQDGLIEQINNFMKDHAETRLIVIDTLEHIRNNGYDKNMYSYDYRDMNRLREVTNKYDLTLLLIHHTRKMYDSDPINTISGSTGLVGAVDGVWVLEKDKRTDTEGKLTISNRDTKEFCFKLAFDTDKCLWLLTDKDGSNSKEPDNLCPIINDFLTDCWKGSATELCNALKKKDESFDYTPLSISKELKNKEAILMKKYGISVSFERKRDKRTVYLIRNNIAE